MTADEPGLTTRGVIRPRLGLVAGSAHFSTMGRMGSAERWPVQGTPVAGSLDCNGHHLL